MESALALAAGSPDPIMHVLRWIQLFVVALTLWGGGTASAREITVFAAASLKNALDEVVEAYEASSGRRVAASLAGSSVLARQIYQGAPADVFISANIAWMDWLADEHLVDERRELISNRLVAVVPATSSMNPGTMAELVHRMDDGLLAMAMVDAVPAGIYGKAALETLDLWSTLRPRVVQTDNVRAALRLVAIGEVELGIVYTTDAIAEPAVRVVHHFDSADHPPIVYPIATVTGGQPAAAAFVDYLFLASTRAVFSRHGFELPEVP